ncbi:hypothetical protein HWV62_15990 [Athelia sp. TMB]|nr:hypothetical protein HWV62_15990 [Athelia sp. TMB]
MNVSSYVPVEVAIISFTPYHLWGYYVQYLWNYEPTSWVARIALAVKVLAIFLVLPLAVLAMLDVSSYVVARTLGVVDVVKASTNAPIELSVHTKSRGKSRSRDPPRREAPTIVVSAPPLTPQTPVFATTSDADEAPTPSTTPPSEAEQHRETDPTVSEEEADGLAELSQLDESPFSNEKLYGVGVFSPATSRPPSPVITRVKPLPTVLNDHISGDEIGVRQRRKYDVGGTRAGLSGITAQDSSEESN